MQVKLAVRFGMPVLAFVLSGAARAQGRFSEPTTLRVDPAQSYVLAVTGVEGVLSFLGHRHSILATSFDAEACVDTSAGRAGSSRVVVTIPTRSLRIDTPRGRELAELGESLDREQIAELEEKMLGPRFLAADRYPELRLEATRIVAQGENEFLLEGNLTVRGRMNAVRIPVRVEELSGGAMRLTGSFPITHSEYGMEPESVAGVVEVSDSIDLSFSLYAVPEPGC